MGNAVQHRATGRQAQPPPPELPKRGLGGAAPLPGLPLLPQPLRTAVTRPPLVPGTGRICHRADPSQMAAGRCRVPWAAAAPPTPGAAPFPPSPGAAGTPRDAHGHAAFPHAPRCVSWRSGGPGGGQVEQHPQIRLGRPRQSQLSN